MQALAEGSQQVKAVALAARSSLLQLAKNICLWFCPSPLLKSALALPWPYLDLHSQGWTQKAVWEPAVPKTRTRQRFPFHPKSHDPPDLTLKALAFFWPHGTVSPKYKEEISEKLPAKKNKRGISHPTCYRERREKNIRKMQGLTDKNRATGRDRNWAFKKDREEGTIFLTHFR